MQTITYLYYWLISIIPHYTSTWVAFDEFVNDNGILEKVSRCPVECIGEDEEVPDYVAYVPCFTWMGWWRGSITEDHDFYTWKEFMEMANGNE